jgi:hypothetical protein
MKPVRPARIALAISLVCLMTSGAQAGDPPLFSQDGAWVELPPPTRSTQAAIYDPVRDRMLVFGGSDGLFRNDTWSLPLDGAAGWTPVATTGTPPSPRIRSGEIYDPVRDRLLVLGGVDATPQTVNDAWELSLGATPTWRRLLPFGHAPDVLQLGTVVYDTTRDRLLVLARDTDSTDVDNVWALSLTDPPAWTELLPAKNAPSQRIWDTAIYDAVRGSILALDGSGSYSPSEDAWEISLGDTLVWSHLSPAGGLPVARTDAAAIYDATRDRMLLCGGFDFTLSRNDVWALRLSDPPLWTRLSPTGTPLNGRGGHTVVRDSRRDRLLVFGGGNFGGLFGDTWALALADPPAWSKISPLHSPPDVRSGHTAIRDPRRDRMLVFAGATDGSLTNDVWALSLADAPVWSQISPAGTPPIPRTGHTSVYDAAHDRMLVFGGTRATTFLNDTWALSLADPPAWSQLLPAGNPPYQRSGHAAIYDAAHDRMLVFGGGTSDGSFLNDVWSLSLGDAPAWTQLSPAGATPIERVHPTALYDSLRARMLVFGGMANGVDLNDTWALSLGDSPAWTENTPAGSPPTGRSGHTAVYDPRRDRMLVFGGLGGSITDLGETWELALSGTTAWRQLAPAGGPPAGGQLHAAIFDPPRDRMLVFGGVNAPSSTWAFLSQGITAVTWSDVVAAPGPGFVDIHCTVFLDAAARLAALRSSAEDGDYSLVSDEKPVGAGRSSFEFRDTTVEPTRAYFYRLGCREGDRWTYSPPVRVTTPDYALASLRVLPNPASPGTAHFVVEVARASHVRLDLFDVNGRRVRALLQGPVRAGKHSLAWDSRGEDGRPLANGIYVARLESNGLVTNCRVVLAK